MQKLSSIVTKKDLQQYWHDFEPNRSLVYAYAVGVHEKVSLLLDCKGTVRSAYWGTNHDPVKKSIERPYVLFERAHIKPTFRMAFRSRRAVALICMEPAAAQTLQGIYPGATFAFHTCIIF